MSTAAAMPNETIDTGRLLRFEDVMEKLGISRSMIYRLARKGKLEVVTVGERSRRVTERSFNAFMAKVMSESESV